MDEEGLLPTSFFEMSIPQPIAVDTTDLSVQYDKLLSRMDNFQAEVEKVGVNWEAALDVHTHSLEINGVGLGANSHRPELVAFDMDVIRRLDDSRVELVTNSFTQCWLEDKHNPLMEIKLADHLIIENIPSYQSPEGPYHECVEEAREDRFLKDFRRWVVDRSVAATQDELSEIKRGVEQSIQKAQDDIFLKYLHPRTQMISTGKSIIGGVVDLFAPGISAVATLAEEVNNYFERRDRRWQGFLVSTRSLRER